MTDLIDELGDDIQALESRVKAIQSEQRALEQVQAFNDKFYLFGFDDDYLLAHYQANMKAFEFYFPDIYAVMKDYKPSRYHIDLVEGQPNIRDVETGKFLYSYSPYITSVLQYQSFCQNPKFTDGAVLLNETNAAGFLHSHYLNQLIRHSQQCLDTLDTKVLPNSLGEMLVFGVGLGFHLEQLVHNHRIRHLYVIEPDLDLFYSSLFTTAWHQLLPLIDQRGDTIHLNLGTDEADFFDTYMAQSARFGIYNVSRAYGFVHHGSEKVSKILAEYKTRFYELTHGWGFYDDAVIAIAHQGKNLESQAGFLRNDKPLVFDDVPVLICANGPSLDQQADFIKANQGKAIVISCGTALRSLHRYGIEPDFHCEQERTKITVGVLDKVEDDDFVAKRVLIAPGSVHPEVFDKFTTKFQLLKDREASSFALLTMAGFKESHESANNINPTVSNTALYAAIHMGFKNIILLGVDLGYRPEGHHHSVQSMYYDKDGKDVNFFKKTDDHVVPGNFGGEIITNSFFNLSRVNIERLLNKHPHINCYNCNDGVAIKGTQPCHIEQIALDGSLDKQALIEQILTEKVDACITHEQQQQYWQILSPQLVNAVCQKMLTLLATPVTDRMAAKALMEEMMETLRDEFRAGRPQIYSIFEGSLLYFQSLLVRLLFSSVKEETAIGWFNDGLIIYRDFIDAIPEHYQAHYQQLDLLDYDSWREKHNG
ncbi:motility associated factor glycosyltransferase family protein [Gallaecimonas mangrovi]|uniref:motility associated factor glycosyltransferase family protein n=1 Tax=Gallaecimonas mangrovi TaxID=2291597 RepID=UPI000E207A28|nr:6-hydroxymethylpterin diphosphokinase MptE-like protein [Gallaecimonas mangrovi]